jgi:radical SAM protein with 4Fe4S-binding SPASM domain
MEPIPDYAYLWRPFAARQMINKPFQVPDRGEFVFVVDPWTRRWAIVELAACEVLRRADGRERLSAIARALGNGGASGIDVCRVAKELAGIGLLFDSQVEHERAGVPVYNHSDVVGLHIEITNACNMTCTHCYVSSGRPLPQEMSEEEILRVIDMLPPFSGKRIALSGGEPIVRKGCMDIVEYCVRHGGHHVDLYTNGRKFPRPFAERILRLNEYSAASVRVQLSLEGATSRTHDLVRGLGSFKDATESLAMFQEVGLNRSTVLFVCLTKHNIGEVGALIELAERFDVAMLVFSQWQRQGNARDTPWRSIAPTLEEWVAAGEQILAYRNERLQVYGNFYGDLNNRDDGRFCLDSPLFPKHIYFYNAFPRVTPQGEIFADQLWVDPNWILGSIRTGDDLTTCFQSPKFHGQLESMRQRVGHIPTCQTCAWVALCEAGSPGHTYAEYGHVNERDVFCESRIYWFNRYMNHQIQKTFGDVPAA